MANSVVVRSSVTGSASTELGEIVVQIVIDSRRVLGAGVRSEVTVTVNVPETVLLTVAVLGISAGAEETSQVFVAVSLSVQLLQKIRRLVTREVPHTIENR